MSVFGTEISEDCVLVYEKGITKSAALDGLIDAVSQTSAVLEREPLRAAVQAREETCSTGVGNGLAIPHVRSDAVCEPVIGVGVSRSGIEYSAMDDQPVHIVVLFAVPSASNQVYLRLLAEAMLSLKAPEFRKRLAACKTSKEAVALLNKPGN